MSDCPGNGDAMHRTFDHAWRLVGTGIAFACVFVGGGLLAAVILPVIVLLPGDRQTRMRRVIHRVFRVYVRTLILLGLIRLHATGTRYLSDARGHLVIANHPSLLDVVLLMSYMPNAQCIIKNQLWRHPFLGVLMRSAGYIRNDLPSDAMIEACATALGRGDCLIIFPEGTRTRPGDTPRFQRGFANLAILTGAPIRPVVITCDPPTLVKGERWWHIPPHAPLFTLAVGDCLDPDIYTRYQYRSIAARKLVQYLEAHYMERLLHG